MGKIHNVVQQHRVDIQFSGCRLEFHNLSGGAHGTQLFQGLTVPEALQNPALLGLGGGIHGDAHEEPV